MQKVLILIAFIAVVYAAPLPYGPMKISDNNIENIYNINININGVFSSNVNEDIVNVIVGLLNQQGVSANGNGMTMKDQLKALVEQSKSKDVDIDIPGSSLMSTDGLNVENLTGKLQQALQKGLKPNAATDEIVTN
ncbi:unnamed protein product [Diamesa hyperborea]